MAGRPAPDVPEIPPAEAFSRAADAFYRLLCALDDADWRKPALRGLDIQGLVGHLIGVETDTQRGLRSDPDVAEASHVASTQAAAERQSGCSPAQTRAEWRRAADATLALIGPAVGPAVGSAGGGAEVALHGMRLPLRALLIVRAFELWTHENDIRLAAGLPASVPDPATLRLMSDLAVRLLPYAAARASLPEPAEVHLVLTGPGGGTWDVTVGAADAVAPAALSIVTDVVGFCRLAANRVAPDELDVHVTGPAGTAAGLLAAASTLALD
jgi:uncharacterized protein (TIGR03083 family)